MPLSHEKNLLLSNPFFLSHAQQHCLLKQNKTLGRSPLGLML